MKKWSEKRLLEIAKGVKETSEKYNFPTVPKKPKKAKKAE